MSSDGFTADYRLYCSLIQGTQYKRQPFSVGRPRTTACPAALFRAQNTSTAVHTVLALFRQTHCAQQPGRPHELTAIVGQSLSGRPAQVKMN